MPIMRSIVPSIDIPTGCCEGLLHRRTMEQLERVQELHAMLQAELERGNATAAGHVMALQFDEAIIALITDTQTT